MPKATQIAAVIATSLLPCSIFAGDNSVNNDYPWLALTALPPAVLLLNEIRRYRLRQGQSRTLATTREHLQAALWGSGDGLWDWDLQSSRTVRHGIGEMLGLSSDQLNASSNALFERIHEHDQSAFLRAVGQHLSGKSEHFEIEYRLRHRDGHWLWVLDRGRLLSRDRNGAPLRMAGTTKNITARKRIEDELQIAAAVLDNMSEAVLITDLELRVQRINPAFEASFGYRLHDILGRDIAFLHSAEHDAEQRQRLHQDLRLSGFWRGELWQKRRDGGELLMQVDLKLLRGSSGQPTHFVGVYTDITERKRAENELRYLASFDALTGLHNRSYFQRQLQLAVQDARLYKRGCAVLFIDIDHFKNVNDSLGHAQGDVLLQQMAARLRHATDKNDLLARLGGDEFTVLLKDDVDERRIIKAARRLLEAFREPFSLQSQEIGLSPSIGISIYPEHGQDANTLLRCADMALYRAKAMGRGSYQFYAHDLEQAASRRLSIETALRRALERRELELHFQPRMAAQSERIAGYEALIRWRSEQLGAVAPDEFICIAEDSGIINAIGDWVLVTACTRAAEWAQQGAPSRISVNLSGRQLQQGGLAHRVQTILHATGLSADLLELEVTESVLIGTQDIVLQNLSYLRRLGVRLALDDFGTGYSQFGYLNRYSFDTIKIPREFVKDIGKEKSAGAIAAAIIELAHNLHMKTVAEGVETREQFEYLRQLGCEEVQGYYVGQASLEPALVPEQRECISE